MKAKEWICPCYRRKVDDCECLDLYLIAMRAVRDEALVSEQDRDALYAMCRVCGKHGVIEGK